MKNNAARTVFRLRFGTFAVKSRCSVISYMRGGKHYDLSVIGRIGNRFLVSAHTCCENDFAHSLLTSPQGVSFKTCAVIKHQ